MLREKRFISPITALRSTPALLGALILIVLFALLVYSALMWMAKLLVSRGNAQEMRHILVWGGIVLMAIFYTIHTFEGLKDPKPEKVSEGKKEEA